MSNYEKQFCFSIPTMKIKGQENKGERAGKKVTYCFLRHVIGLTLLALKLCMIDPSPSTHCWKTQKHRNAKLGKLKREKVGKFVLGEGSSLKPWIMLIACAEEKTTDVTAHTMEKSSHISSILPITISSSPRQRDLCFPFFQMLHVVPAVLINQFIASQGKWSTDWFIKASIYILDEHLPPFWWWGAIWAITRYHYPACQDIFPWSSLEKEWNKILIS